MQIVIAITLLLAAWIGFAIYGHGYPNTVEHLAWLLKRHAREVREMHEKRRAIVAERWVREIEK